MPKQVYIIRDPIHDELMNEPYRLVITDHEGWRACATLYRFDMVEHIDTGEDEWEKVVAMTVKFDGQTSLHFDWIELYDNDEFQALYRAISASMAIICGTFEPDNIDPELLIVPDGLEVEGA